VAAATTVAQDPMGVARNTFDLLIQEYLALRAEICQSINKQHQILLLGCGLTASLMGYAFRSSGGPSSAPPVAWEVMAVVPIALLAMGSLWTVECNRMIRASYYLAYQLWPDLHRCVAIEKTDVHADGWERWIRSSSDAASAFRRTQHLMQLIVSFILPVIITAVVYILLFINTTSIIVRIISIVVCTLVTIGWIVMLVVMPKISDLSGYSQEPRN
jgi:hypothetical protein